MAWFLVPDRLDRVFQKLKMDWDFPVQPSPGFKEIQKEKILSNWQEKIAF